MDSAIITGQLVDKVPNRFLTAVPPAVKVPAASSCCRLKATPMEKTFGSAFHIYTKVGAKNFAYVNQRSHCA